MCIFFYVDGRPCHGFIRKFQAEFAKRNIKTHFNGKHFTCDTIKMLHIASGIQCVILFRKDDTILHAVALLKQFFNKYPMCKDSL